MYIFIQKSAKKNHQSSSPPSSISFLTDRYSQNINNYYLTIAQPYKSPLSVPHIKSYPSHIFLISLFFLQAYRGIYPQIFQAHNLHSALHSLQYHMTYNQLPI